MKTRRGENFNNQSGDMIEPSKAAVKASLICTAKICDFGSRGAAKEIVLALDDFAARAVAAERERLRSPTKEMLLAARVAEHNHYWPHKTPTEHTWTALPSALVGKIWKAMIAVAASA